MRFMIAAGVFALVLSGCAASPAATPGASPAATPAPASSGASPALFSPGAGFDYQLGGTYPPPPGVTVVTRDSLDDPEPGLYSICYVNAFQTQPGAEWPDDLVVLEASGARLVDPNWPDENIIDISTPGKRMDAAAKVTAMIDRCASAGFDAVEFDNLDSYTRSQDALTLDNAVDFATVLVARAHELGLAAGQKNTGELGTRGRDDIGFDFAVVEECDQFDECASFTEVYGDGVIDIEYTDELRRPFAQVCDDAATPASTILRDRNLSPAGSSDYVYESC